MMQQLSSIIERELKLYAIEVKEATRAAALTVGKEIVEELRQTSPRRKNGGRYAKSWKVKRYGRNGAAVHNAKHYRLTHLLEYGHDVKRGGKKIGEAKAYPHIKKAEERGVQKFIDEVEKLLNSM